MQNHLPNTTPFFSPIVLMEPERVAGSPTWLGHAPFAFWLIEAIQPRLLVDLGIDTGNSFASLLQAVKRCNYSTFCCAVGAWDDDGNFDDVYQDLSLYLESHYPGMFGLIRSDLNDTLTYFSNGSIDLLHIHGLQAYDLVRHDFEVWLPKMSERGVVLLDDIYVRENDYGSWRLWDELIQVYPSFSFRHSHGLGVLAVGQSIPAPLRVFLDATNTDSVCTTAVRDLFARLGGYIICNCARIDISVALQDSRRETQRYKDEVVKLKNQLNSHHAILSASLANEERFRTSYHAEVEDLRTALTAAERESEQWHSRYAALIKSTSWQVTAPLRFLTKILTGATQTVKRQECLKRNKSYSDVNNASAIHCQPDPRALFDEKWYRLKYPDTQDWDDVYRHYIELGAAEGRDPSPLFSTRWYLEKYPEVAIANLNPLLHFCECGMRDRRNPHRLFDSNWYLSTYVDVAESGQNPLLHYIRSGAANLRNPNPNFDAHYYVEKHPDAAENPLRHYILYGEPEGWSTRKCCNVEDFMPFRASRIVPPDGISVDVVIPVYRGLVETKSCLASVLADDRRPPGKIIVIDDCSPEPNLSSWLVDLATDGVIILLRNSVNLGFVGSVNRGIIVSGANDVVLLNSDTEVPCGWLERLLAQAYFEHKVATVTPYSNNATICSFPALQGQPLPVGYSYTDVDQACQSANGTRSIKIPSAVGFCMYIRRDCLNEVGLFDEETFGRGYGEENDFCMRAAALGWHHLLACNVFVYHAGEISFGIDSPERNNASVILQQRHPSFPIIVDRYVGKDPGGPYRFAATVALFAASPLPKLLLITNHYKDEIKCHIDDSMLCLEGEANLLLLRIESHGIELSVPVLTGLPVLELGWDQDSVVRVLRAFALDRIHIHGVLDLGADFIKHTMSILGLPFDIMLYDNCSVDHS
jgi:GT2 family glycosyltransferase